VKEEQNEPRQQQRDCGRQRCDLKNEIDGDQVGHDRNEKHNAQRRRSGEQEQDGYDNLDQS
jgi:hypothetical protein